jgi:hypothetical protein
MPSPLASHAGPIAVVAGLAFAAVDVWRLLAADRSLDRIEMMLRAVALRAGRPLAARLPFVRPDRWVYSGGLPDVGPASSAPIRGKLHAATFLRRRSPWKHALSVH